jgi:hypothetical protein
MGSLVSLATTPAMAGVISDLDRDDHERLLELVRLAAPDPAQAARFAAAARQAGHALERLKPALLAATADGVLAGVYSVYPAGTALLLAADGARSIAVGARIAALDDIAAKVEGLLAHPDAAPEWTLARRHGGLLTLVAGPNIAHYGRDAREVDPGGRMGDLLSGLMLEQVTARDLLRRMGGIGVVPAVVCLLAAGRDGALLLPLAHGRAWPEAALREAEGSA